MVSWFLCFAARVRLLAIDPKYAKLLSTPSEWDDLRSSQQGQAWRLAQDWKQFLFHEIGKREPRWSDRDKSMVGGAKDMPWGSKGTPPATCESARAKVAPCR